tara:strand:+ start:15995 stop:16510 length:516 start_codon:yes stop_codon:yes gene_type:complete
MEECAVCLEETLDRVKPCGHAVCKSCATKWMMRKNYTCPLCRQPMFGDPEDEDKSANTIVIDPRNGTFFGVTVRNTPSGEGVLVTHTDPRDLVHASGIRANVVITHINNTRVNEPQTAVLLLEAATTSEVRIRLQTRTTSPFTSVVRAIRTAVSRRFRRPRISVVSTSVPS